MIITNQRIAEQFKFYFGGGPGAPPPPPKPPVPSDAAASPLIRKQMAQDQRRQGFQSTILTGGMGVSNAQGVGKTLLGG